MGLNFCSEPVVKTVRFTVTLHMINAFQKFIILFNYRLLYYGSLWSYVNEPANTHASIPPVSTCVPVILLLVKKNHHRNAGMHDW